MPVIGVGTKLVVFDRMREGQPDEYLVAEDEAGNMWSIQPVFLCGPDDPDLLIYRSRRIPGRIVERLSVGAAS